LTAAQPRRIAVAFHEQALAGASLSLLRVVPLLESRGWELSFWVPGSGAAEQELRRRGYRVETAERLLRLSLGGLRESPGVLRRLASTPRYLRAWRRWVTAQQAELIHANTALALPEALARPRGGPPVVLQVHEVLGPGRAGSAAARLARRVDSVVAVSEAVARPLRARGVEPQIVYSAVPDPPEAAPRAARTGLVVGTLGTVSRHKGSDVFVAVAQRLSEAGIEFRLAGAPIAGPERAWAEALLASAAADGVVHRPWVDPYEELADWDVLLAPSRTEAFGLAVQEAMAMGVPVVASRVGGIPEQVDEESGILVEPDDVEGFAEAVRRLAADAGLRASLGEAGRHRRERLFTLERQAEQLDAVYRSTLAAARPA
jgi:glycosyltransferase involved in cell wall biosynthesis